MDIDLVYLWVDGSDLVWRAKRNEFLHDADIAVISHEATDEARFRSLDELKFSLRSVEKYAPWIRHIYIVTDNQVPLWLNLNNPRVSIVDHKEIMPPLALPTYSSPAIEWCVDNIPGLSEHFLLANDDTFIAEEVSPDFFFNEKGHPIVRLKKWPSRKMGRSQYLKTIGKAQELVRQHFGKYIKHIPHHNIDAYRKSDLAQCRCEFEEIFHKTMIQKFREKESVQRSIYGYYSLAKGYGESKIVNNFSTKFIAACFFALPLPLPKMFSASTTAF